MTLAADDMTTNALAPWYGSDRMVCERIGRELDGHPCVGIPFCGGLSVAKHITARTLICADLHRHVINLANVAKDRTLGPLLYRRLRRLAFHPHALAAAQAKCQEIEQSAEVSGLFGGGVQPVAEPRDLEWAVAYFVCAWMARNGDAGTDSEFRAGMSVRWDAGGGDSAGRFRSATSSLIAWRRVLSRGTFTVQDAFELIKSFLDRDEREQKKPAEKRKLRNALYVDAPWPGAGDCYRHKFGANKQLALATTLARFNPETTRVVVRFGDHPRIRELYPQDTWTWVLRTSRAQDNGEVSEALIINGPSCAQEGAHA